LWLRPEPGYHPSPISLAQRTRFSQAREPRPTCYVTASIQRQCSIVVVAPGGGVSCGDTGVRGDRAEGQYEAIRRILAPSTDPRPGISWPGGPKGSPRLAWARTGEPCAKPSGVPLVPADGHQAGHRADGAWRVAAVAILLAVTVVGLRTSSTFSHTPNSTVAGASGTVLLTVLAAGEGIALVAFIVVLAMARPQRQPR
jgi:hypothetical protein